MQGLETGLWALYIDNIEVGSYLAATLDTGINLAENTKTPMYQQALQVAKKSYLASEWMPTFYEESLGLKPFY
ncbi:hypothetical protein [Colwellia piezophila]|uniref:hypothetical protein n=1 Tax=Colwellia piezophila TaxID=211668 RepID=UPI0003780EB4|nr:hypothetical protein [Colwellia piezophila]